MESGDVVKGTAAEATAFNLLRADVITTIAAGSVTAGEVVAHTAASTAIHGLDSGEYFLGIGLGGRRIETGYETKTLAGNAGDYCGITWANAFAALPDIVLYSIESSQVYAKEDRLIERSTTGATIYLKNSSGDEKTFYVSFLAIGL